MLWASPEAPMATTSIRRLRGPIREAHAREVLGRLAPSGLSKAAFCRSEGISPVTLGRWLGEFGSDARASTGTGFVEVRLDRGSSRPTFQLELSSGRRLHIPPGFDVAELERLLAVVERAPC